jgi:potassium-transporting ATPase KdpC subunit
MIVHIRRSVVLVVAALVLTFAFAFLGTGVSQILFRHQADGSITANGSTLIGQNWSDTKCPGHALGSCVFQGRPDDLGPYASASLSPAEHPGDDPLVANGAAGESGATNLGPRSAELEKYTKELISYWHKRGVNPTSDLVTTSGSGIDPDITPDDARAEIPMVSAATGLSHAVLAHLISVETQGPELGFLGSTYIDVLQLNEALVHLEK